MVRIQFKNPRLRNLLLGLLSAACLAFTASAAYVLIVRPEAVEAPIVGRFELTDDEGQAVTEATYAGSYMLVYFGYTFCPDICPTELTKLTNALEQFEAKSPERAEKVVPIFISVDPERDTQAVLKDYTDYFHPRLVALSGTPAQLRKAAAAFKVYFAKVYADERARQTNEYLIDHSSQIYLMGPDARYLTHFTAANSAEDIAAALDRRVP
jgi:cytochrome oxidase Cu insertion factor (SCO1/SenC/PrrC family)